MGGIFLLSAWIDDTLDFFEHALEHLRQGEEFDLKIAFISIDIAVEFSLKTFILLPAELTGIGIRYGEQQKIRKEQKFHLFIDALEKYGESRMKRTELGAILSFHDIRNSLYHEGHKFSVSKKKVEAYRDIARKLIVNLFDMDSHEVDYSVEVRIPAKPDFYSNDDENENRVEFLIQNLVDLTKIHLLQNLKNFFCIEVYSDAELSVSSPVINAPSRYFTFIQDLVDEVIENYDNEKLWEKNCDIKGLHDVLFPMSVMIS